MILINNDFSRSRELLGGMHIFTAPKHKDLLQSRQRAYFENGQVIHLLEASYHGNPISTKGSLVTWDYGADFIELAERWSGYQTSVYILHDRRMGIDGEFMDVFVTVKDQANCVTQLTKKIGAIKGASSNATQL